MTAHPIDRETVELVNVARRWCHACHRPALIESTFAIVRNREPQGLEQHVACEDCGHQP